MDDESRNELESLVVSFLQSCLNEYRYGVTLEYFQRFFAEKTEEASNWYTRFNARNALEALQSIPNAVCIANDRRTNSVLISINKTSDKADPLLIDLITGQKSSAKRKRPNLGRATSQRVVDSFDLNRKYSSSNYSTENRFRNQLNSHSQSSYRSNSYSASNRNYSQSYTRQASHNEPARASPADPRLRQAKHAPMPSPTANAHKPPTTPSRPTAPASIPPTHRVHASSALTHHSVTSQNQKEKALNDAQKRVSLDPNLGQKRTYLRQKLIQLLMSKSAEIKLLYLPYLYHDQYNEELDPKVFGHKSISSLLQEPFFSEYFKIEYKDVFSTVSLKIVGVNDRPVAPANSNGTEATEKATHNSGPFGNKSMTEIQKKFNAIDPFNISTMIQTLEPLRAQEPVLGKNQIEDIILYRTMRIILTGENQTLKLEEWERKYQQAWNYNNRIRISDYGCRTLLEFFKCLAVELPIKTHLIDDEWVAKSSKKEITEWINKKLSEGKYKALIVFDPKYDQIAYPGDSYPLLDITNLTEKEFYPAMIMSVDKNRMWLQMRIPNRIRDHLTIETSLTCYEDHKKKNYFNVCPALLKVGFPCVAYDDAQQRWCRAVIIAVPEVKEKDSVVTAFLVDYAITKKFNISQLSCILKNHLKHPVCLVYAQLHGIEKDKIDLATRMLKEFTSPPVTLACKIVASTVKPANDEVDIIWPKKKDIRTVTLVDTRHNDCYLADAINKSTSTFED